MDRIETENDIISVTESSSLSEGPANKKHKKSDPENTMDYLQSTTVYGNLMDDTRYQLVKTISNKIEEIDKINIYLYMVRLNNLGYLSITFHWIDDDWNMCKLHLVIITTHKAIQD
ncbi:4056_t:CDS:2 [Funneliformis caledonium]|uniref:4056_t:CDS:1 n=1 Tax=Funneliformis caledonium TaxID=1117310 RepID=A0A9N9CY98_9GLOM|nr:4056_t:CDS:2 [Funneliformis caledonium]